MNPIKKISLISALSLILFNFLPGEADEKRRNKKLNFDACVISEDSINLNELIIVFKKHDDKNIEFLEKVLSYEQKYSNSRLFKLKNLKKRIEPFYKTKPEKETEKFFSSSTLSKRDRLRLERKKKFHSLMAESSLSRTYSIETGVNSCIELNELAEKLLQSSKIKYIFPSLKAQNHNYKLGTPNDINFVDQTALKASKFPEAWSKSTGRQVKVGILDLFYFPTHPELSLNYSGDGYGSNFNQLPIDLIRPGYVPEELFHGIHIGGIIAAEADNNYGIAGAAPDSRVVFASILNDNPDQISQEGLPYSQLQTVEAISFLVESGVEVINYSAGRYYEYTDDEINEDPEFVAFKNAILSGVSVVVSAGNANLPMVVDGPVQNVPFVHDCPDLRPDVPCIDKLVKLPSVLVTGSVTNNNWKSSFSSYGEEVNITAQGENVATSSLNFVQGGLVPTIFSFDGTSFSAPFVSSAVALLKESRPELNPESVTKIITAKENTDAVNSAVPIGRKLNAKKAIDALFNLISIEEFDKFTVNFQQYGKTVVVRWDKLPDYAKDKVEYWLDGQKFESKEDKLILNFEGLGNHELKVRVCNIVTCSYDRTFDFSIEEAYKTFHNYENKYDVDHDGIISPRDALLIINALNGNKSSLHLTSMDVNNDGVLAPVDVLQVINKLNSISEGEGESKTHLDISTEASVVEVHADGPGLLLKLDGETLDYRNESYDDVKTIISLENENVRVALYGTNQADLLRYSNRGVSLKSEHDDIVIENLGAYLKAYALAGNDNLEVETTDESIYFFESHSRVRTPEANYFYFYGFDSSSAKQTIESASGSRVLAFDSAGDDLFVSQANGTLDLNYANGYSVHVENFESSFLYSRNGGNDKALINDSLGLDRLYIGRDTTLYSYAEQYNFKRFYQFEKIEAIGTQDTNNRYRLRSNPPSYSLKGNWTKF